MRENFFMIQTVPQKKGAEGPGQNDLGFNS